MARFATNRNKPKQSETK